MDLTELSRRAMEIHSRYAALESARGGRPWTRAELAQGFVGDVGDLMKLLMAKDGRRPAENLDARLAHELADCLWSVLVLAKLSEVDLEKAFLATMEELRARTTPV
jgi:NTP pyrophosphatase (non-canonical NTP hydrolase)